MPDKPLTTAEKRLIKIFESQSEKRQQQATPRVKAAVKKAKGKKVTKRTTAEDRRDQERQLGLR